MNYTSINEPDKFSFEAAQIISAESVNGDLIWRIGNAAALAEHPQNKAEADVYLENAEITFRSFRIKSAVLMGRRQLDSDYKKVRETKPHTLYKSELTPLVEKMSEGMELFSLSLINGDEKIITAEICSDTDASLYTVEISCDTFILSWEDYGAPVLHRKPTLKERAEQLKMDIPAVFLALGHKDTPKTAKVMSAAAVCYALSPIDLIPDFIPVLGYIDDVLILPGLVYMAIRLIPDEVMKECRMKAVDLWTDGKPQKWIYALPVIIIWFIIIGLIISAI